MNNFYFILTALACAVSTGFAEDKRAEGVWTWSVAGQNGETVCDLNHSGEKVSGSYVNEYGKADLAEGSLKDDQIRFKIKREMGGKPFILQYSGKVVGDQIVGKLEFQVNGETKSLDWNARRDVAKTAAKAANKAAPAPPAVPKE